MRRSRSWGGVNGHFDCCHWHAPCLHACCSPFTIHEVSQAERSGCSHECGPSKDLLCYSYMTRLQSTLRYGDTACSDGAGRKLQEGPCAPLRQSSRRQRRPARRDRPPAPRLYGAAALHQASFPRSQARRPPGAFDVARCTRRMAVPSQCFASSQAGIHAAAARASHFSFSVVIVAWCTTAKLTSLQNQLCQRRRPQLHG